MLIIYKLIPIVTGQLCNFAKLQQKKDRLCLV